MKLILDFDGVIGLENDIITIEDTRYCRFRDYLVDNLRQLIKDKNITDILIISNWRKDKDLNYLKDTFKLQGHEDLSLMVTDMLPYLNTRFFSLLEYIEENKDDYILIDDIIDDKVYDVAKYYKKNYNKTLLIYKTDFKEGLSKEFINKQ